MSICPHCGRGTAVSSVGLTRRQLALLDWIKSYMAKNKGQSPSYDEMRVMMGLKSQTGIHRMIVALEERGHIKRTPYRARTVVPV